MTIRAMAAAAAALTAGWTVLDYARWRALGPGGLPSTPLGWLIMSALRIRAWRVDPFDTTGLSGSGHLTGPLAVRPGLQPTVARYPVPHRQLDQYPDPHFTSGLTIASFVAARPALSRGRSYFERHIDAAFAAPGSPIDADGEVSGGEIGHIHADGSLHVVLASADAAQCIDARWGELHPLSGRAMGLPHQYVLLYAPRDPHEVTVIEHLLDAAAKHMTADQQSVTVQPGGNR
jgi:Family of unknown function (DUF5519)